MKVAFDLRAEDLVALNMAFYVLRSPQIQRQIRTAQAIVILAYSAFFAFLVYVSPSRLLGALILGPLGLLAAFSFALLLRSHYHWRYKRNLRRFIDNDAGQGVVGPYVVTLAEDGIEDQTQSRQSKTRWDGVSKVIVSDKYLFLRAAGGDFVIPRRAFSDECQFNELVEVIRRRAPTSADWMTAK
jgi:hypothetical protein